MKNRFYSIFGKQKSNLVSDFEIISNCHSERSEESHSRYFSLLNSYRNTFILVILFTIFIGILIVACTDSNKPNTNNNNNLSNCPRRFYNDIGVLFPALIFQNQKISNDYKKLICDIGEGGGTELLDLTTMSLTDITSILSNALIATFGDSIHLVFNPGTPIFCPYNSNRALFYCCTETDTVGDRKKFVFGYNYYIISLDGKEVTRVTPPYFGKAGTVDGFTIYGWLIGSNQTIDSLLLNDQIYIPQINKFISSNPNIWYISKTNNYWYGEESTNFPGQEKGIVINGKHFLLSETASEITYASFSQTNKYLALSILPIEQGKNDSNWRYNEVWIIDLQKTLSMGLDTATIYKKINLRKNFCMYSDNGVQAEFMSDNTLAVGMHHDSAAVSNLWEIDIDGNLIKNLTNK